VKQKLTIFGLGLFAGLVAGFVITNYLNRPEFAPGASPTAAAQRQGQPPPGDPHTNETGRPEISDEELAHIKQTVDSRPDKYDDQLMLAEYLMRERHEPEDAIKYYERANALKPTEIKPLVGLGDANLDAASSTADEAKRNEMLAKATGYYEKALAVEPKNVNYRTDLGLTYFFRTPPETEKAIAQFRKSLEIDPKHEITLLNLSVALLAKGDAPAAEESITSLAAVNPSNERIPKLRADLDRVKAGEKIPTH
jgi:tetratricopeptide (TPR) repeat protein